MALKLRDELIRLNKEYHKNLKSEALNDSEEFIYRQIEGRIIDNVFHQGLSEDFSDTFTVHPRIDITVVDVAKIQAKFINEGLMVNLAIVPQRVHFCSNKVRGIVSFIAYYELSDLK